MTVENLSLRELYIDHLQDIYSAESQITETLPLIIQQATDPKLRQELKDHLKETNGQIARLDQILDSLNVNAHGKKSVGMAGLLEKGNQEIHERSGGFNLLDNTLVALCQKIKHYEVLTYGTVIAFAELLGDTEALGSLTKTLDEKKAAEEKLIQLGSADVIRTPQDLGESKLRGPSMKDELNTNDSLGG